MDEKGQGLVEHTMDKCKITWCEEPRACFHYCKDHHKDICNNGCRPIDIKPKEPTLQSKVDALPERQRMVFEYAMAGATERWIALNMGIKLQTVKNHKQEVFKKLGVYDILDAILRLKDEKHGT